MKTVPTLHPGGPSSPAQADPSEIKWRLLAYEQSRLEQAKRNFLAAASHELGSPVALIQGYSSLLAQMSQSGRLDAEEAKEIVQRIMDGARRLGQVIKDTLDTTAIEANALELLLRPLAPAKVIRLALQDLRRAIAKQKLSISVEGLTKLPKIEGDVIHLRHAFRNIVSDSVHHTPLRGQISISARLLDASPVQSDMVASAKPPFVETIIADNSAGIAPEDQGHIFDRVCEIAVLNQAGRNASRKRGGSLELAVARGIIEAHGGLVWVESEGYDEQRNPGARFHIALPVKMPRQRHRIQVALQRYRSGSPTR